MTLARCLALIFSVSVLIGSAATVTPGAGIVVDRSGRIYITDAASGVWKYEAGKLTLLESRQGRIWLALDLEGDLGRNGSTQAQRVTPRDDRPSVLAGSDRPIAVGPQGELFFGGNVEGGALQIMRRKPDGDAFVVGNIPDNAKGKKLRRVNGIAAGPDGAIYVAGNHTIRKLTKEGTVSTVVGPLSTIPECASIPGVKAGWLPYLRSLAADASGTVWVAAEGCGAVLKIPPGGEAKAILKTETPWSPTAVTLAGSDLYVLEVLHTTGKPRTWTPRVRKVSTDGRTETVFTLDRDAEKAKSAKR